MQLPRATLAEMGMPRPLKQITLLGFCKAVPKKSDEEVEELLEEQNAKKEAASKLREEREAWPAAFATQKGVPWPAPSRGGWWGVRADSPMPYSGGLTKLSPS